MTSKLQIVIADRGWVYIGNVEKTADGITIVNAHNIRRWGTDNGLGQLAASGPTENTRLDAYGTVYVPTHAVVGLIDVAAVDAWAGAIQPVAA